MRQLVSQSYDFLKSEPVSKLAIVHPLPYEQKTVVKSHIISKEVSILFSIEKSFTHCCEQTF